MKTISVAFLAALGWVVAGQGGTGNAKAADTARFVLGINRDESLTLDGKAVTREVLAKEWPRLAEQIREEAKAEGEKLDPKQGLPAVITIRAADETPYSLINALSLEAQKCGFRKWQFVPQSLRPDPPLIPLPVRPAVRAEPSGLPATLRTIPIRLRADNQGMIGRTTLGEIELQDFQALRLELSDIQNDPDLPFDQAILSIDSKLKFSELVRMTDLLVNYRITKISFIEMRAGDDD